MSAMGQQLPRRPTAAVSALPPKADMGVDAHFGSDNQCYRSQSVTKPSARTNMKLTPQDLEKITDLTVSHYNQRAEDFWEGTRDHNVNQNIAALLQSIEAQAPYTILDFGCGPGRDLKVFADIGHVAIGLEGAKHFAVMARAHSGCEVWQQDFLTICRITILMAYSPMPLCFMYPARSWRACCWSCVQV